MLYSTGYLNHQPDLDFLHNSSNVTVETFSCFGTGSVFQQNAPVSPPQGWHSAKVAARHITAACLEDVGVVFWGNLGKTFGKIAISYKSHWLWVMYICTFTVCVERIYVYYCIYIYTYAYLEPKWLLFWLKRALFWRVDLQKYRSVGF